MLSLLKLLKFIFTAILPPQARYPAARVLARLVYRFDARRRQVLISNLTPVVGTARAPRVAPVVLENFFLSSVDFFCRSSSGIPVIESEQEGILEACRRQFQNVVIATAHIGPWELGLPYLIDKGYPMAGIYAPYRADRIVRWIQTHRHPSIEWIRGGKESVEMSLRALRHGKILGIVADLPFGGRSVPVQMCGKEALLPIGPWAIAVRARAAVIPAFILRESKNQFRIIFCEPLLPGAGTFKGQIHRLMTGYAQSFEKILKIHADQWGALEPFWTPT